MRKRELAECANMNSIISLHEKLKAISDLNRLKILCLLFKGERCVYEIEEQLDISQPLASHHLSVLREAGLVEVRKVAKWSYYSLATEAINELNREFLDTLGAQKLDESVIGHSSS